MFTDQERKKIDELLSLGYVDIFRRDNRRAGEYTWWPYYREARERNIGWRIDYFFASKETAKDIKKITIKKDVMGSDHCPVIIEM